mmetsp:Transcript_26169/g.78514  ORF Transcript_26169/g.78514 Transcript_26169/m.78514 type:complete len:211 (+) Transcript_26169:146-778(+)
MVGVDQRQQRVDRAERVPETVVRHERAGPRAAAAVGRPVHRSARARLVQPPRERQRAVEARVEDDEVAALPAGRRRRVVDVRVRDARPREQRVPLVLGLEAHGFEGPRRLAVRPHELRPQVEPRLLLGNKRSRHAHLGRRRVPREAETKAVVAVPLEGARGRLRADVVRKAARDAAGVPRSSRVRARPVAVGLLVAVAPAAAQLDADPLF